MKSYWLILVALLFTIKGFSQVSKVYITSEGKFSDTPQKAVSYILVEKVSDTAYLVKNFDMRDTMLMQGYYKDAQLKIPHGRFYYYNKPKMNVKARGTLLYVDTNNYVKSTGFFVNGSKTGKWLEYVRRGLKDCEYTYENDKLNGLFQEFNVSTGDISQEGNFFDDKQEGDWDFYKTGFERPVYTRVFHKGKLIKTVTHLTNSQPTVDLESYLNNGLKLYKDTLNKMHLQVMMSINEQGKIDSVKFSLPLTGDMNKAVTEAFLNYPKFHPALYDGQAIKQSRVFNFIDMGFKDQIEEQEINKRTGIIARHANDVGRGLNSVGFGKPVY